MAAGLFIHRAQRTGPLVDALAALPAPADPFAPELIALQSRGMRRWLEMRLAEARGVVANLHFTSVGALIADVVRAALDLSGDDPWTPGRLRWHVLDVLDDPDACASLPPLARYLSDAEDGSDDRRRVLVASRLAAVLHRYTVHRPELVAAWASGATLDEAPAWQATLWRAVASRVARAHPGYPPIGARVARLSAAIPAHGAAALDGLPERCVVFGLNTLPPVYVDALACVSKIREVHVFTTVPFADEPSHPLAASMARPMHALQRLLAQVEGATVVHHEGSDVVGRSRLARLHRDIARGTPSEWGPAAPDDGSIMVHSAHTPLRQVEVARDRLLDLLQADPTLQPRDILVMTPNIGTYEPLIRAVFADGGGPGGARGFPALHRVHDLSLRRHNLWTEAFSRLLELVDKRWTATEVVDLASLPAVRITADFDDDDIEALRRWVQGANVRWGLDADHRADFGLPPANHHTWREGIDRALLGHAVTRDAGPGEERAIVGGLVPWDQHEGDEAERTGRTIDWIERLLLRLRRLRAGRWPLARWRDELVETANDLLVRGEASEAACQPIFAALSRLLADAPEAYARPLDFLALRAIVASRFTERHPSVGFLSGELTFCTMVPMRNLPFRVVVLLGMDDGAFPRAAGGDSFDLTLAEERPGDRTVRTDDRLAFFEAIAAAEEALVVTFAGRSAADNKPRPPCGPVAELLATLRRADKTFTVVEHPLSPFSPLSFGVRPDGGPREPLAYDRRLLDGARALVGPKAAPPAFLGTPLEAPCDPPSPELDLDDLIAFLKDPAKGFFRARLGASLGEWGDEQSDHVPLELNALDAWRLGMDAIRWRRAGADWDTVERLWRGRGDLPPAAAGEVVSASRRAKIEPVVAALMTRSGGRQAEPRVVQIELDEAVIVGAVPTVPEVGLVVGTASKFSGASVIEGWVRHLALQAAGQRTEGFVACRDRGVLFGPMEAADARAALADLVALTRHGQAAPLAFHAKASWAFVWTTKTGRGDPHRAAENAAAPFDKADPCPHLVRLYGSNQAVVSQPAFPDLAGRVFGPVFDACWVSEGYA